MTKDYLIKFLSENVGKEVTLVLNGYSHTFIVTTAHPTRVSGTRFEESMYISFGLENILDIVPGRLKNINGRSGTVGSDPEFFFVRDGDVVPSHLVIQTETDHVKRDGVQGELNPDSDSCRQVAGSYIARAIIEAQSTAQKVGATVSLDVGHVLTDAAWKSIPMDMRRFGCNPTENIHEQKFKRVSGLRERFRAAGGHIHLGFTKSSRSIKELVTVLDIVAGNTCVLVDRDPMNARRRRNYGRAGEYREKSYGLEYRVLSNFWLKSYALWSMASGLCRQSIGIVDAGLAKDLISRFDMTKVRDAINLNDPVLALENYKILAQFFKEHKLYSTVGLSIENVDRVERWLSGDNPMSLITDGTITSAINSWQDKLDRGSSAMGFEKFITTLK